MTMSTSSNSSSNSAATAAATTTTTLTVQEKWDHSLENFVRKTSIGFAVGVLPALLLTRSLPVRCAFMALCSGVGSGVAYGEAHYLFDRNVLFDKRHVVYVHTARPAYTTAMAGATTTTHSDSDGDGDGKAAAHNTL